MRNQKTIDLVYLALFLAIIVVMSQVPLIGFIPLGFTTATIIHIPVIIAAIYFGKKMGALTGFVFGLASCVTAYIRPTGVFDLFFQNPVISVLPRIVFGFLTAVLYQSLKGIKNGYLRASITALFASLMHTVLVVGTLLVVYYGKTKTFIDNNGNEQVLTISFALIGIILLLSMIGEAILSTLIAPPVVSALNVSNKHLVNKDELIIEE